jgi:hypothetical protein
MPNPNWKDGVTLTFSIPIYAVNNVLEGHILMKNPREQMTNRDVPHFIHTQTLRIQHVINAFQSNNVPISVLLVKRN